MSIKWNQYTGTWDNISESADITHNNTTGKQGGTTGEYYHTTSAQNSALHASGSDTTLGTMAADINMNNSYQVVNLQAPAASGEAIRQTTKITEVGLELDADQRLTYDASYTAILSTVGGTQYKLPVLNNYSFQKPVIDKDITTLPGSPAKGDRYLLIIGSIQEYNGTTWDAVTATEGMITWVNDENLYYIFNGTTWVALTNHVQSHAITSTTDHTSTATSGKMLKADASGLPVNASNTDTEVASAVTLKHTQNTDTTLIVADTSIVITDTGTNGVITMKADNTSKLLVDAAGVKPQNLTAGRVPYVGANKELLDDSDLTFSTDTLTATNVAATTLNLSSGGAFKAKLFSGTMDSDSSTSFAHGLTRTNIIGGTVLIQRSGASVLMDVGTGLTGTSDGNRCYIDDTNFVFDGVGVNNQGVAYRVILFYV